MSRPAASLLSRFFFSQPSADTASRAARWCSAGLVGGVLAACGWVLLRGSGLRWDWEAVGAYWGLFLSGWKTTVGISLAALLLSTLLGAGLALAQRSNFLPLRYLAKCWIELIRGTPLLVQI
jgi:polar amino acid transport system permease protein